MNLSIFNKRIISIVTKLCILVTNLRIYNLVIKNQLQYNILELVYYNKN